MRGQFPAQSLAQELDDVDIGRNDWREVCFVQFLCVRFVYVSVVISVAPGIPLLAEAGVKNLRGKAKGPVEEDAPITQHGKKSDIA